MFCCDPNDPMDCAERAACEQAGLAGHTFCGTCAEHGRARHACGCAAALAQPVYELPRLTPEEMEAEWARLEAYFATLS